jgi:two-component system sensor histidine kinase YesM
MLRLANKTGIRFRLVFAYIALITIPLALLSVRYYGTSKELVSDIVRTNTYEMLVKNNENIDGKLSVIMENMINFTVDKDVFDAFNGHNPSNDYEIKLLDDQLTPIIEKHFTRPSDIYSAQLATSYYAFGASSGLSGGKPFIPKNTFTSTELYRAAVTGDSSPVWVPTYEFSDMFHADYLKGVSLDFKYMFSVVQRIRGAYSDGRNFFSLPDDVEKPVLIINLKEDFYRKAFDNSIPVKGGYYFVMSRDGTIVSHQDSSMLASKITDKALLGLASEESGTKRMKIGTQDVVVCFVTSKITGWTSVMVIPAKNMLGEIPATFKSNLILSALLLIPLAIFLSIFLTGRITKPIRRLASAIHKTGSGNFEIHIEETGAKEFKLLTHKYNIMNQKIQRLIEENYEIALREKEAEIMALNLQLDPHFMYNTLNLINLIALDNDQDEISEMIENLSVMLQYSVKTNKDIVPFGGDLEYLKGYILIMTKRFEGRFHIEYDIDPLLYAYGVPKFFMQPFVENAFVHGFESMQSHGVLIISGRLINKECVFRIEDNGKGMDESTLTQLDEPAARSVGIQNVLRRIHILYGKQYGILIESKLGKGTKVTIRLPAD